MLIIAVISAFVGTLPPAKFFAHYLYAVIPPLVALYSLSNGRYKAATLAAGAIFLALAVLRPFISDVGTLTEMKSNYDFSQYRQLKNLVGENKLLTIRAHPAIIYLGDIDPAQPLVWIDHPKIMYGPREDEYFVDQLARQPNFVATMADLCNGPAAHQPLPTTCAGLAAGYHQVMSIKDRDSWRRVAVYQKIR